MKKCAFCKERTVYEKLPWCSICWYEIPASMRKDFEKDQLTEKNLQNYLEVHKQSIKQFGGGKNG